MTPQEKFKARYEYAQRNGFTGTIDEYIQDQYWSYAAIVVRNGITPMNKEEWLEVCV